MLDLPAANYSLSPYTGFSREHWEAAADGLLAHAWKWASPQGGRLDLPGRSSVSGVRSDGLEGYARTFLAAACRVAGANGDDPHQWLPRYAEGLAAGTKSPGADDAESWPVIQDVDVFGQPMVESACIALSLRLTRPWLWDQLSPQVQDQAEAWLRGSLTSVPAPSNWYLFPYTVAGFLESVGRGDSLTARVREHALTLLDSWYAGEGWYTDGNGGGIDYYNGWALHLYPVLDELLASREQGVPLNRTGTYPQRLSAHLDSYGRFFAANGASVHFGRSMTYRFAAGAAIGLGGVTGATPLSPGASRRILSGNLKYFLDRGSLDENGLLSLGWHGEHAASCQPYSGPGSPYWASKAFVCLLAPADDPLWTDQEDPAPAEQSDHVQALPDVGLLVQSTQEDGIVRLHNHGTDGFHAERAEADIARNALYNRWSYSTHTGPTAERNIADNEFTLRWRGRAGSRVRPHRLGAWASGGRGWAASWHTPVFETGLRVFPGLRVTSVCLVSGIYELRIHRVEGAPAESAAESTGWAVPRGRSKDPVTGLLVALAGWEHTDEVVAPAGTAYASSATVTRLRRLSGADGLYVSIAALTGGDHEADVSQAIEDLRVSEDAVTFRWRGDTADSTVRFRPFSVDLQEAPHPPEVII
ncbi:DUF2264 domain-containing protein [Nesterenkonia rhizosphaerae]